MALDQNSCNIPVGEEFFEFEVNATSIRLSFSCNPLAEQYDFKSNVFSSFHLQEIIPTPADKLFCNGQSLHFLPKKTHKTNSFSDNGYKYLLPLSPNATHCKTTNPSQSRRVTQFQPCRQSSHLKFDEYFSDYENSNFLVIGDWLRESRSTSMKCRLSGQKLKALGEYLKSLFRKRLRFSLVTPAKPSSQTKPVRERKSKDAHNTNISRSTVKSTFRVSQKERHCILSCKTGKEIYRDSLRGSWIRSLNWSINQLSKITHSLVSPISGAASLPSSPSPAYFPYKKHSDDMNCVINRSRFIQEPEKSIVGAVLHCKQSQMLETRHCENSSYK